jgi:hypothetical protein
MRERHRLVLGGTNATNVQQVMSRFKKKPVRAHKALRSYLLKRSSLPDARWLVWRLEPSARQRTI